MMEDPRVREDEGFRLRRGRVHVRVVVAQGSRAKPDAHGLPEHQEADGGCSAMPM